jgi:outer membrane protein assembly factor BamD (BamD/ComL family)
VAPAPKARPRSPPVLYEEIAVLEGVRVALDQGDSRDALRRLDAYDGTFPRSVLAEEATVLRIDALSQIGNQTAAASLARSFLAANPSSPHAPHLRALTSGVHNP